MIRRLGFLDSIAYNYWFKWEHRTRAGIASQLSKWACPTRIPTPIMRTSCATVHCKHTSMQIAESPCRWSGQENHLSLLDSPLRHRLHHWHHRKLRKSFISNAVPAIYVKNSLARSLSETSISSCQNPAGLSGTQITCSTSQSQFAEIVTRWKAVNQFSLIYLEVRPNDLKQSISTLVFMQNWRWITWYRWLQLSWKMIQQGSRITFWKAVQVNSMLPWIFQVAQLMSFTMAKLLSDINISWQ